MEQNPSNSKEVRLAPQTDSNFCLSAQWGFGYGYDWAGVLYGCAVGSTGVTSSGLRPAKQWWYFVPVNDATINANKDTYFIVPTDHILDMATRALIGQQISLVYPGSPVYQGALLEDLNESDPYQMWALSTNGQVADIASAAQPAASPVSGDNSGILRNTATSSGESTNQHYTGSSDASSSGSSTDTSTAGANDSGDSSSGSPSDGNGIPAAAAAAADEPVTVTQTATATTTTTVTTTTTSSAAVVTSSTSTTTPNANALLTIATPNVLTAAAVTASTTARAAAATAAAATTTAAAAAAETTNNLVASIVAHVKSVI
ncbi:uncharacterized protein L969DRAFT_87376 [Mixia osmundae IAM 14324]|nr:uncharacterized protein L969DRAFT_87376 [Mixia osmundae IAM 14324]KEI39420.1 hypothetical protein L969DRAFT_87376 [Mixia osmundae IAM 14324]